PGFDRIMQPFVQNMRQIGINASYNRIDDSQYELRSRDFDWDMTYDGYRNSLEEGTGLDQRYGSEAVGDLFNPAGYSSLAVDQLAREVVLAQTRDEMEAAVRAIDRIMRDAYFMVPSYYKPTYWLA